jgi:hypothetical protein
MSLGDSSIGTNYFSSSNVSILNPFNLVLSLGFVTGLISIYILPEYPSVKV